MPAPYQHLDMTPEYNRIITALTGIRDDIRLLQKLQSDPESGIISSNVLNDFQRALLAVSMSSAVGNTAVAVSETVVSGNSTNGGGTAAASGASNSDLTAERATILTALGVTEDPADLKVLIRVAGIYYWEAAGTAGPDDGQRGPVKAITPFALGEVLGFDDEITNTVLPGAPAPPTSYANPAEPRKRWPFARPVGQTASQNANPNANLVDPATGKVIAKTAASIKAENAASTTAAPATDYSPGAS